MGKLKVKPQTENANKHSPYGMGLLETSIGRDGWIDAITVAADDESISGSARIEVGATKGWDFAHEEPLVVKAPKDRPIVVETDGSQPLIHRRIDIPNADHPMARRLSVAANQITAMDWVPDATVLEGWAAADDAIKGLFTDDSWASLLAGVGEPDAGGGGDDFDGTPAVEGPTRTAVGDVFALGDHRLLCGDCTKVEHVRFLMGNTHASAVVTDPPYGIDASSMTMGKGQSDRPQRERLSYQQGWDKERPDVMHLLRLARWACIWGGNYFADMLPVTSDWLCWWKKNDGRSFAEFELAWTNYGGNARHFEHHWSGEEKQHITQKPLAVMMWCIQQCPDASLILDPYLGSGTTLIAAHRLGFCCYGIEISERYCDVILQRWEAETGQEARLERRLSD